MPLGNDGRLADIEIVDRAQQAEPDPCIFAFRLGHGDAAERSFRDENLGRHLMGAAQDEALFLEEGGDMREEMSVAAAAGAQEPAQHADRLPVQPETGDPRPEDIADDDHFAAAMPAERR